ncbi:hypothetical protein N7471_003112 [Penicillium samsonianum]|uniref:uncharacterized protein n=1 Tax=Penicillium samsonianum TaxID=1882272 RepID=UPI0025473707|nr:uncharacterized protein N7471_003112 [Penicillium samsonianum]KAJ6143659.1 hypothetical protein N7471_003112 [Penicillium samsonianum]
MSEILNKSENDGTGDQTQSETTIPLQPPSPSGPGILTVTLDLAYRLSLPDDLDLHGVNVTGPEVDERWRAYAIAEYEGFQLSTEAMAITTEGVVAWASVYRPFKFHVSASPSSELTISMFIEDMKPDASGRQENTPVPLGLIKLNPFLETSNWQDLDVQNGTGKVTIKISYTQKEDSPLETWDEWRVRGDRDLVNVEKDTGQNYGMTAIDNYAYDADISRSDIKLAPSLGLCSTIQHPFIAPLNFAFKSERLLKLLSPLGSGGYLFDHLQKARRFDTNKAKFYAAELVCILEYLHDKHIILSSLKPENILLDSSGHISLCKPGLFALISENMGDVDLILPGTAEYPAPEVLNDHRASRVVDWWALGLILYEMLTGIPPFCHKDDGERRHRIIGQDLELPESLPSTAKDILTKLLAKIPTQRLGTNGATEVKAHAFFHDVKWHECLQRKSATPFKPHDASVVFWRDPYTYQSFRAVRERKVRDGVVYEHLQADMPTWWLSVGRVNDKSNAASKKVSLNPGDDDVLESQELTAQELHFIKNLFTDKTDSTKPEIASPSSICPPVIGPPSEKQKKEALAAALEAGHSKHVFSHILSYGMDLNVRILNYDQTPCDLDIILNTRDEIELTPLEWAVEHERLDLVNIFLDNGADANYTIFQEHGPALFKAVKNKHQNMVEVLVLRTNRISCTRALALAVEQQDTTIANILLAHGVSCDFEESDRPRPPEPIFRDHDSQMDRELESEDITPPLVRATRLGNAALVALLIEHGADTNVAYHDLGGRPTRPPFGAYKSRDSRIPANFSCGRVVQLAMEMGHSTIVQLLIDAGADIDLPHPLWPIPVWPIPGHICLPVPRAVYVEVTAGLEEVVAERKKDRA